MVAYGPTRSQTCPCPLSRDDLAPLLAKLDAAVPGVLELHVDEAVKVLACMGEDIADQAGPDRVRGEDRVAVILTRRVAGLRG